MGRALYLDCTSGISGDMTVAALLDLGASEERLRAALETLPVDGFEIAVSRVMKSGLAACDFDVRLDAAHENHDHDMAYLYGHLQGAGEHVAGGHGHTHGGHGPESVMCGHEGAGHDHVHHHGDACGHGHGHADGHGHAHAHEDAGHGHRSLAEIEAIIEGSGLSPHAKELARRVFGKLATAEATAHGTTPDAVLLHEVGAVDSIVDICAVAVCLDELGVTELIVPVLAEGTGTVRCAHGIMPVPVPAVANLCAAAGIVLQPTGVRGELVTPTGAAIVAALRTADALPARYRIECVGIGAGKRPYEGCSGVLRAMLVEALDGSASYVPRTVPGEPTEVLKLETDIDDCTGEALGRTIELLMAAGAREAHAVPIIMKKGRPAYQLEVICDEGHAGVLERVLFENTTTIGIRRVTMGTSKLAREEGSVETPFGAIAVKRVVLPDGAERAYPEYDSVVAACDRTGASFQDVFRATQAACEA